MILGETAQTLGKALKFAYYIQKDPNKNLLSKYNDLAMPKIGNSNKSLHAFRRNVGNETRDPKTWRCCETTSRLAVTLWFAALLGCSASTRNEPARPDDAETPRLSQTSSKAPPTKTQAVKPKDDLLDDISELTANEIKPTETRQPETKDILDAEKQKFIWDAEHITFQLEQRFGKRFRKALTVKADDQIASLLRNSFSATLIDKASNKSQARVRTKGPVQERFFDNSSDSKSIKVNASAFAANVIADASTFAKIEGTGLRVLKIDRVPNSSEDSADQQRWKTQILLTITGIGPQGELKAFDSLQDVEFEFEEEEQIDGGPVVASWHETSSRWRTSSQMLMQEVTAEFGLDKLPLIDNWTTTLQPQQFRFQMAVEDYDRDGFLDIAIASNTGKPYLLKANGKNGFDQIADEAGLFPWDPLQLRYLATWIDYDNDGFPDLILGSRLYHNQQGKSFRDVTASSGLTFNQRPMGCAIADYDGDGLLDIYVLYQYSDDAVSIGTVPWVGDDSTGQQNQLWKNEGNGRFRNVTKESKTGGGQRNSFAATWLFLDDDHYPDLYVANDFGANVMHRNRGDGAFEDVSQSTGVADYATSMGVAAGDINNDGRTELYVANMYSKMGRRIIDHVDASDYNPGIYEQIKGACAGNRLYCFSDETNSYKDLSTDLGVNGIGWAFAPAMVDLDNDGLLDMYATTGFMSFDREKPDG